MKITEIIFESKEINDKRWFDGKKIITATDVLDYVRVIHPDKDDFTREDAIIEPNIKWFTSYKLKSLPLSTINLRKFDVLDDLVDAYASKNTPFPPIVYDPIRKIVIDGMHRVNAAKKRGDDSILALVGETPSE